MRLSGFKNFHPPSLHIQEITAEKSVLYSFSKIHVTSESRGNTRLKKKTKKHSLLDVAIAPAPIIIYSHHCIQVAAEA